MLILESLEEFLALLDKLSTEGLSSSGYSGLRLDLSGKQVGAAGAAKLAEALGSGRCPSGLQLNLGFNPINEAGVIKLVEALESGHCPSGLQLTFDNYNRIGVAVRNKIHKLLDANEKRHVALACVAFRQGLRSERSSVKKLPENLLNHVFRFVLPATAPKIVTLFFSQIRQAAWRERLATESKTEAKSISTENKISLKQLT